jgi:hypothetical protein
MTCSESRHHCSLFAKANKYTNFMVKLNTRRHIPSKRGFRKNVYLKRQGVSKNKRRVKKMSIPDTVESILQLLESYTERPVRERELLAIILRHAAATEKMEELGQLAFHAKYVTNLLDRLGKQPVPPEHTEHLEQELSAGLEQFHSMIGSFVADLPPDEKTTLDRDLLALSDTALQRILHVAADLSSLKSLEREFVDFESSAEAHVPDKKSH